MISVIIGTYGSERWRDLAWSRAYASVPVGVDTVVVHGETLAEARNTGARAARNEWLCFLDADDELNAGYLDAMWKVIQHAACCVDHTHLKALFTPAVQYVAGKHTGQPMFHPEVPIEQGNWLVIGTVVPRDLFNAVGGFEEWPKYEDWALFARMQKAGAKPVKVPEAVYRAHVNPRGRNYEGGRSANVEAHDMIRRAVFPELYQEAV